MGDPLILLYDGSCGLCHGIVRFLLRRDAAGRIRYAAIQGPFAHAILARHGRSSEVLDTVFVVLDAGGPDERLLEKGRAALHALGAVGGAWRILAALRVLPRVLLDFGYDLVARSRYRLFGRADLCALPDPSQRSRFLDEPAPQV